MTKYAIPSTFVTLVLALVFVSACEKPNSTQTNNTPTTPPAKTDAATHADSSAGHGGPIVELGTATIGSFSVRASRDQGEIKPGGDAPIDVWLTGGDISKVTAVRFWIGTEQGDQFVKAKADIEIPSEPNHWHTHAEVASPLPAGSKLWVEIEVDGQKHTGSFDLKA